MPADLQYLSDRLEIEDLLHRYAEAVEQKDWSLLATCFTPDAAVDYSASGGAKGSFDEASAFLAQTIPMFSATHFLVANSRVELAGDEATARTHFQTTMVLSNDGGSQYLIVGGYYNDRLRRTDDGWRITERVEEPAFMDSFRPPKG
jgi:ketosteroid isomerase-like protein